MPIIKAQVELPYFTGLPEDLATNTLYFAPVAIVPVDTITDILDRIDAAYAAVDQLLSPVLTGVKIVKLYDMSDPEPRVPIFEGVVDPITTGTVGYAEEVAAVLSFRAAYAAGEPNSRRRGRIYLGPLSTSAVEAGDANSFSRLGGAAWGGVLTGFVAGLVGTAPGNADGGPWVVYSRTDGIGRNVIEAWRDDAADTQRRRGAAPTTRSTLAVVQP